MRTSSNMIVLNEKDSSATLLFTKSPFPLWRVPFCCHTNSAGISRLLTTSSARHIRENVSPAIGGSNIDATIVTVMGSSGTEEVTHNNKFQTHTSV